VNANKFVDINGNTANRVAHSLSTLLNTTNQMNYTVII